MIGMDADWRVEIGPWGGVTSAPGGRRVDTVQVATDDMVYIFQVSETMAMARARNIRLMSYF